jgi:hypothetical protein
MPANTNNVGPFFNSRLPADPPSNQQQLLTELNSLDAALFGPIPSPPPLTRTSDHRHTAQVEDDRTVLDILYQLEHNVLMLRTQVDRVMRTVQANNHCVRDIRASQQQQMQADLNAGRTSPVAYSPSSPHY